MNRATTPWGHEPLVERQPRDMRLGGVNYSFPETVDRIGTEPAGEVRRISSPAGDEHCVGGAEVARRSHKPEVEGSNPSPATTLLTDDATLFLRLIAAHHRCDLAAAIERAAAHYCNKMIGLQRLADLREELEARPPP